LNSLWTFKFANFSIANNTICQNSGFGIIAYGNVTPIITDCILWYNKDDLQFNLFLTNSTVKYSDIEYGNYADTNGNISADPLFVTGIQGKYYLSQTNAWQSQQSPCVNNGSLPASSLGLQIMTTRTDEVPDEEQVDMGYHFSISTPTSVNIEPTVKFPNAFELSQNYPNPFNPETVIQYQLPKSAEVHLEIYSILGQLVRTIVNEKQPEGYYTAHWNGKDEQGRPLASSVYIYRLSAGEFVQVRKMLLVR